MTLADRIEALDGPSREVDAEIAPLQGYRIVDEGHPIGRVCYDQKNHGVPLPAYTASLDAAMTLVPEGWFVDNLAQYRSDLTWWCSLIRPFEGDEETGKIIRDTARVSSFYQVTPALALCAAALRSRGSE